MAVKAMTVQIDVNTYIDNSYQRLGVVLRIC